MEKMLCGAEGRPIGENIPPDAASRRDAQIRYCASRGCNWCYCLNLLAGGFESKLLDYYTWEERETLYEKADSLMGERMKHVKRRQRRGWRRPKVEAKQLSVENQDPIEYEMPLTGGG